MFELYHGLEFTVYYPFYISVLISVTLGVLWRLNVDSPLVDSSLQRTETIRLSASVLAFKAKGELSIGRSILILKKVKMKISGDDENIHFSSSKNNKLNQEEKNEKTTYSDTNHHGFGFAFIRLPGSRRGTNVLPKYICRTF